MLRTRDRELRRGSAGSLRLSFYTALSSTLIPSFGVGAATFTRATTATITDFEGSIVNCLVNEARFYGARREQNLVKTEFNATGWTLLNATLTTGVLAPDGTNTAYTLTATATNGYIGYFIGSPPAGIKNYNFSVWIRRRTGTGNILVYSDASPITLTGVTSSWQRFSIPDNNNLIAINNLIRCATSGDAVDIWHPQGINTSGRSNQNPPEYVSNGVPVGLGSELVMNGTFDTDTSGWSTSNATFVASGGVATLTNTATSVGFAGRSITTVVGKSYVLQGTYTKGTATAAWLAVGTSLYSYNIAYQQLSANGSFLVYFVASVATTYVTFLNNDATNGNYSIVDNISVKETVYHGVGVDGVKCFAYKNPNQVVSNVVYSQTSPAVAGEAQATNTFLQSNTFSSASWLKARSSISPNVIQSWDGTLTGDKLITDNTAAASHYIYQSQSYVSGTTYTMSIYAKAGEYGFCTLELPSTAFTTAQRATINLTTGATTVNVGSATVTSTDAGNGWWRLSVTAAATVTTAANPICYIAEGAADFTISGDGVSGIYIADAQHEVGSAPTSRITTTTEIVTRIENISDTTLDGYLSEQSRTNYFLNSAAPVTQTSGSLATGTYTLWMTGTGSVAVAGNTATITGAGTAVTGTPVTFVVTVLGTVDFTVTGTPTIVQAENGAYASSYIPTTAATVTRNADMLSYPTDAFLSTTNSTMSFKHTPRYNSDSTPIYLTLTGVAGTYLSSPDSAAADIIYDIDISSYCALTDWTPAAQNAIVSKYGGAGTRSYMFEVASPNGRLVLFFTQDGTTGIAVTSTASPTITDGQALWVRFTRAYLSGDVKFYTSTDGITWTQLGTTVSGTAGALYSGSALLNIGAWSSGANYPFAGKIYSVQIYNGIRESGGVLAVDFNAARDAMSTTGTVTSATTNEVWTLNGAATINTTTTAVWGSYVDASNETTILYNGNNLMLNKRIAGVGYKSSILHTFISDTTYNVACSWGAGGVDISIDGANGNTNTNGTAAQLGTTFQIGADGNSTQQPFGCLEELKFYKSKMTAAQLAARTAITIGFIFSLAQNSFNYTSFF